jgi:hypothetical protein
MHFSDEALPRVSAIAASPPDEDVLEIRARAEDAILGPAHFKRAEAATRRASAVLESPLAYGRYAALAACLFGFAWMGHSYFSSPARTVAQQESAENARATHASQKMAEEVRALKAKVEAMHAAQGPGANDAAALGMNPHLDTANTATNAAVAEAAGKVEHLKRESESAATRSKVSERFDRIGDKVAALLAAAPVAERSASEAPVVRKRAQRAHDAFDPSQNPTAPGAPRSLGTLASAASANNSPSQNAYGGGGGRTN